MTHTHSMSLISMTENWKEWVLVEPGLGVVSFTSFCLVLQTKNRLQKKTTTRFRGKHSNRLIQSKWSITVHMAPSTVVPCQRCLAPPRHGHPHQRWKLHKHHRWCGRWSWGTPFLKENEMGFEKLVRSGKLNMAGWKMDPTWRCIPYWK